MAVNYITVDRGKQMGSELLGIIETLRLYSDKVRQHKELMDNMTDGVTYTNIETQYGIASTKGDETYNLISGAVSELAADTNFSQLLDWFVPVV